MAGRDKERSPIRLVCTRAARAPIPDRILQCWESTSGWQGSWNQQGNTPLVLFTQLALKNWRNFREVSVDLTERVFLVGPNASGKSNLLDAFRFLRDLAKPGGGLQDALQSRGGLSTVRCLSARNDPTVSIDVSLNNDKGEWRYELEMRQEVRGNRLPLVSKERVWKEGRVLLDRPNQDDQKDQDRLTQTHLEQINANAEFREIGQFFSRVEYLHMVPQLLRHRDAFTGPGVPGDPFGRGLLERIVRTPEKTRRSRLRKIEKALQIAVPQFSSLRDQRDEMGTPHLEVKYEHWRPQGAWQREDQLSDGTLRLLGLLWSLLDGDGVLLLEEPELSLHPGLVAQLPPLIHRLTRSKRRQVFISTHSYDLLKDRGIDAAEILLLQPQKEGSAVVLAASDKEVKALLQSGLTPAEAVIPATTPAGAYQLTLFS